MDSSFLTFSPRVLPKKGVLRTKPLKHTHQQLCNSTTRVYNKKKNSRESGSKFESNKDVALDDDDDDISIICEKKSNTKKSQSSPCIDWPTSSNNLFDKKLATLSSKHVRRTECPLSDNDKFEEIKNWLDELHRAHEKKRFTSSYLSPSQYSSSSIVHSSNPKVSNRKPTSCLIIPETSSDESGVSQEKVRLDDTGPVTKSEDTNLNGSKSERNKSSDGSEKFMSRKKIPTHREGSIFTIPETSCSDTTSCTKNQKEVESGNSIPLTKHDEKNLNWRNSGEVVSSDSSSDRNSGSETSLKLLRSKRKALVYSDDESSQGSDRARRCISGIVSENSNEASEEGSLLGNYKRGSEEGTNASSSSDERVSISSTEKLLLETYGEAVDVKEVLTPKIQRRIALVKNSLPEGDLAEKLLSDLYGNNWNKTEVLSPTVHKNVTRKGEGKENTPPESSKKQNIFVGPVENVTPNTNLHRVKLKSLRSQDLLSFLRSLSASPSPTKCDPQALLFKTEFKRKKLELCTELFNLFNAEVFENKLPSTLSITWNKRMYRTAGYCRESWTLGPNGKTRTARIELSHKVCTTADRVRDTLIHELCHAASWLVSGVRCMHGPVWKSWAQKAMRRFPELPPISRCHNYRIETKFIYKCTQCGYSLGRHSKSLDLQRKRCGYCYGKFEVLINSKPRKADEGLPTTPRTPRPISGFALYVRENYKVIKEKNSGLKHGEIMKMLGNKFSKMKVVP